MKQKGLCALASFVAVLTLLASGPMKAQTGDPAAYWKLDEESGTVAKDSSGNGHDGTLMGNAGWAEGFVGAHSLRVRGMSSYVDIPAPVVDTSKNYTVTAWVRVTRIGGFQTFVSIDGEQVSGFFLQLRDDTQEFAFTTLREDSPVEGTVASSTDTPEPNAWYHLAGVHDADKHTLSLYVNGKLQQTVPYTGSWRATGHTVIGRGKFGRNPVDFVNGQIDDVHLYASALPAQSIQNMAQPYLAKAGKLGDEAVSGAPAVLEVNADKVAAHVSPMLYGLMTEEINYSYDGGLYAELIRNRIFKDDPTTPVHWSAVQEGGGAGSIALDTTQPINAALTTCLRLDATGAKSGQRVGIANDGYWGIPFKPNTRYRASFYVKARNGYTGPLNVDLESSDGKTVYARARVPRVTSAWQQVTVTLSTGKGTPSKDNRFVLSTEQPGTLWFNLVSLFPPTYKNRPNGNRPDLMQKMADMKPAFLRLPGGNYLEGDTIPERFAWKTTIHGLNQRPGHQGPWRYRSTDGMGLLEFLEWCEDLKMEPLLAVYAGYSLRGDHVNPGKDLELFVQEALEEIEYATGDKSTTWGAQRAADGHPAPFKIQYVEIGNEDLFDRSGSYDGRFAQFFDAIRAKYPKLKLIATTTVRSRTPDVYDEHYYLSPRAFERAAHRYDTYSRTGTKVFVGEWASQEGQPTPDLNSALGDAAWMTGMERNSDVVILESYAPLLVNVNPGGRQWGTNLIGYDALNSYGSPSYYAQMMFGTHVGDVVPASTMIGGSRLYYSVTRDTKKGMLYLKVVNATGTEQPMQITLNGVQSVEPSGKMTILKSASPKDTNTITEPTKIVPITSPLTGVSKNFTYRFAPYSVTVLEMGVR